MQQKEKFLYKHFHWILFFIEFILGCVIFYQGRKLGLFGLPKPGMDQHTILKTAIEISQGILPIPGKYLYSPSYTLFLALLAKISNLSLPLMRLLQLAISSLIPVMIYKTGIAAKIGHPASAIAGIVWIFCGSALLISLDFLRASPLALCFICLVYFIIKGINDKKFFIIAGIFAGLCMLGRENFIPVVYLPLLLWIFPKIRNKVNFSSIIIYVICSILVMSPILIYNFYHTGSLAILPGNGKNVFEFMQGKGTYSTPLVAILLVIKKIPLTIYNIISPFEIPNSLSVYAHREAIPLLKLLNYPITLHFAFIPAVLLAKPKIKWLLLLLISGYFASIIFCDIYFRFRIPALPLLTLLSGIGIVEIYRVFRDKSIKILTIIPVLLAFALIYFTVPERLLPSSERDATVRFFMDKKDFDKAGNLLLKYRKKGVPSIQGEKVVIYLLVKDGKNEEAMYWHNTFYGNI